MWLWLERAALDANGKVIVVSPGYFTDIEKAKANSDEKLADPKSLWDNSECSYYLNLIVDCNVMN